MSLRAELCDATTGLPVNAGNLETVLSLSYGAGVRKIGSFSLSIPAEDVNAATVAYEQEIKILSSEGQIYRGLIRQKEIQEKQDGSHILVISGYGVEAELSKVTTKTGKTFTQATLSSCVSTLLAMTSGWSAGQLDAPVVTYSKLVKGVSLWSALDDVANVLGCYLRPDSINKQVDIGVLGTLSGIVFRNVEEMTPGLAANPTLYAIQAINIAGDSASVINRIIPLGTSTGLNATTTADFTIGQATVTSPYATVTTTDPDGNALYYIEDTASQALYGVSEIVLRYNGLAPTALTSADFVNAANQLIQQAGADLTRMKALNTSYDVTVVGLKHFANGAPTFQVGDTIRVIYRGIAQDITGKRKWLDIDVNLYVWEFTRTFGADGSDQTRLTLNTVPMGIPSDGNVTRALLEKIQGQAMAPSPFVLLTPHIRADQFGIQIEAPSTSPSLVGMWWLNALSATPGSDTYRAYVDGHANSTEVVGALSAVSGTDTAGVFVTAKGDHSRYALVRPTLFLDPQTSDPAVFGDGMLWYRSDTGKLYARINGVTVALGGGMKVQGSGYQVMPTAAVGINPVNSGVSWTNGAWSQVIASTSEADYIIGFTWEPSTHGTAAWSAEVAIGTGGAGSETEVSYWPVVWNGIAADTAVALAQTPVLLPFPILVATATRVATRVRSSSTTLQPRNIRLIYAAQADLVGV